MVVDANIGALKSDFYVKRSLEYVIDFTGPKPIATLTYHYNHTATYGDWRTSDYHTYTRVLAPAGSKYIEGSRQKTGVSTANDTTFKKTIFGYKVDALMNQTLPTSIQYELPETITADNYQLLIQKQSGTGDIPVKVTMKTLEGEFSQEAILKRYPILLYQNPSNQIEHLYGKQSLQYPALARTPPRHGRSRTHLRRFFPSVPSPKTDSITIFVFPKGACRIRMI